MEIRLIYVLGICFMAVLTLTVLKKILMGGIVCYAIGMSHYIMNQSMTGFLSLEEMAGALILATIIGCLIGVMLAKKIWHTGFVGSVVLLPVILAGIPFLETIFYVAILPCIAKLI